MNPEERQLLERSLRLNEENNKLLKKIDGRAKRAAIYGFIKLAIILLPFVVGYFFLEPYFDDAAENYSTFRETLNSFPL
jgi:hypothetical protein